MLKNKYLINLNSFIIIFIKIIKSICHLLVYTMIVMRVVNVTLLVWKLTHCKPLNLYSYNPSIAICWKGCDYGVGRVNDPKGKN